MVLVNETGERIKQEAQSDSTAMIQHVKAAQKDVKAIIEALSKHLVTELEIMRDRFLPSLENLSAEIAEGGAIIKKEQAMLKSADAEQAAKEKANEETQQATERAERTVEEIKTPEDAEAKARKEIAEAKERARQAAKEYGKAKEAEARAKKEAQQAAKEKAKREAEEAKARAQREAEEAKTAKEAEARAKKEAELVAKEKAEREAEEAKARAQREAEEAKTAKEAEIRAKKEAELRALAPDALTSDVKGNGHRESLEVEKNIKSELATMKAASGQTVDKTIPIAFVDESVTLTPLLDTSTPFEGEIEIAIVPPVDIVQFIQLRRNLLHTQHLKILRTAGFRNEGTVINVVADKPLPLVGMLMEMPAVKTVELWAGKEETDGDFPWDLALEPRPDSYQRKRVLVTLEKEPGPSNASNKFVKACTS